MSLVGEDLADVVHRDRRADDVARFLTGDTAPLVQVERLAPAALLLGVDTEVVQDVALVHPVTELLEQGQRDVAVLDHLWTAEYPVRGHEQVCAVRQHPRVVEVLRRCLCPMGPANRVPQSTLTEPDPRVGERKIALLASGGRVGRAIGDRRQTPAVPAQRLGVLALPFPDHPSLAEQPDRSTRRPCGAAGRSSARRRPRRSGRSARARRRASRPPPTPHRVRADASSAPRAHVRRSRLPRRVRTCCGRGRRR